MDALSSLGAAVGPVEGVRGGRLFEMVDGPAVLYAGCVDAARMRLEAARVVTGIVASMTKACGCEDNGDQRRDGGMRKSDGVWRFCATMFVFTSVCSQQAYI